VGDGGQSVNDQMNEDGARDERASSRPADCDYPSDVHVLDIEGRRLVLVGTAHISQQSVDLVREVIDRERPDCVCVELDAQRYEALSQERRFEAQDLREIIRNQQLAALLMNIVLASYQKRLGMKLGVTPGRELLEATQVADELGIPISLCDRDIRVTLRRAWHALSLWRKLMLVSGVMASAFEDPEISEEELERIRQKDVLTELMKDLGDSMPELKRSLIDERDAFLAKKIRESEGECLVAVVGAGHVEGMIRSIESGAEVDLDEINVVPPVSRAWKWVGWAIPSLIVGSIGYIAWSQGLVAAGENALYWFLANAIPAGIGGLLALAHPTTTIAAFLAAPFTSLTPVIGAGYVAAFVQTWFAPPTVREIRSVGEDIVNLRSWWSNRLLKILMVFILTTLGSMVGTWVGGIEIVKNVIS
jgi:pheromone shutdown-related protein TraB